MAVITTLACEVCIDGSVLEYPTQTGPVMLCNFCTAEYDPITLDLITD